MSTPVRRHPRRFRRMVLLCFFALLLALIVQGYSGEQLGRAGTGPSGPSGQGRVAAAVSRGGPLLLGGEPRSASMPDHTVALTFDDGPDPTWTPQILAVLRRHSVPATFFVVGSRVLAHPELVREESRDGHEIGSHTFTHTELSRLPKWRLRLELALTQEAMAAANGTSVSLLRPPYSSNPGALGADQLAALRNTGRQGYVTVLADRDGEDWQRPGADAIVAKAAPTDGRGAVVLLHDGGGNRSETVEALEQLIVRLSTQGYRFTTVSAALGRAPQASMRPAGAMQRAQGWTLLVAYRVGSGLAGLLRWLLLPIGLLVLLRAMVLVVGARTHRRRAAAARQEPDWLPPVSVVVPAYNEAVGIAATVRSLAGGDYPDIEVVVVDDGSTDGTAEIVADLGLPGVVVIRQPNSGKACALRTGIATARAEVIVLVDGDTILEPDAIRHLVRPLRDPAIGAVAGNAKVGNRRGLLGRWQHIEYVMGANLERRAYDVFDCMPTIPGAIGAFRRSVLRDVGLSEDTLAEDTDLTIALGLAGWRVAYANRAVAWTEAPLTLAALWRQRCRWCYGTLQALFKHRRSVGQRVHPGEDRRCGHIGRRGLPQVVAFQVLLPLAAPAVDVYTVYGLVFLDRVLVASFFLGLVAVQLALAAYAFRLDGERLRPLWSQPLQQVVYRQLLYLVLIRSIATALAGRPLGWGKLARTGQPSVNRVQPAHGAPYRVGTPSGRIRTPLRVLHRGGDRDRVSGTSNDAEVGATDLGHAADRS